ncbi:class I SAM-dependent DNA methyltransferase [Flavobacterium sp. XS1P32]|uniref:class I SAM-dependent DNA methyltransferase n=1 Tax=Flavobacterium sp. XS1P32 TaxID=3401726 RepID=UPI003AB0D5C9
MANLYDEKMAPIFDAMYQTFINYDEEYQFYNHLITQLNCKTVLEIGSGTGNLAKRFLENNQEYIGLDLSENMIALAQKRNKNGIFMRGDMREFKLDTKVDCALITGRSTSYLITNDDVQAAFRSISKNLNKGGILIFDFIDANRFIPFIKENEIILQEAEHEKVKYFRNSNWKTTSAENFMLEWTAQYYTLKNNKKEVIADDFSIVRVFTLNEIQLFLFLNGFEIIQTIDRKTYAYDTYVIVAKQI